MVGSKTLGRVIVFGLGYLAGTRAGRERYAQIEAGLKAVIEMLRARYAENATSTSSSPSGDGYSHIKARRLIDATHRQVPACSRAEA